MAPRKLLNFSGGLDSAYCLYDYLKRGENLVVHHIDLINRQNRHTVEKIAVKNVLNWINRQGFPGKYQYIQSRFDFGTLGHRVLDANIWAFMSGVILAGNKYKDIDTLIVPRHADAFIHIREDFSEQYGDQRSDYLIKVLTKTIARREGKVELPIIHMRKKEVIAAMPKELVKLCWWCRTPNRGRACHRCFTCVQVDPIMKELGFGTR